ncbi:MAG: zinc-ribbon and DUF3426 domain-containing protein [Betaproteobacteria bacterium]
MDLFTRCPDCQTVFRVTTRQLQSSGGQVRCGQCQCVFDAFATLTARDPQIGPENVDVPDVSVPQVESGGPPAQPMATQGTRAPGAVPEPAASDFDWEFRIPEPPRHTAAWIGLALLLLMGLAVQTAYAFRTDVMVLLPQSRDYYLRFCDFLGCEGGSPKLASALHIDVSDLNAVDPASPNEIQLLLSVRNRAPIELAFPAFELTLTNASEQAIARRVFLPADYLASGTSSTGIKAGGDLGIQLYLDTGTLRASGYRVYLFYQ